MGEKYHAPLPASKGVRHPPLGKTPVGACVGSKSRLYGLFGLNRKTKEKTLEIIRAFSV
jgi:hypothetical protein